jgi:two-component system, chemotaxis family, sensor kinase CheA
MDFSDLWKDFLDETLPLVERVETELLALERLPGEGLVGEYAQGAVNRLLGNLHTMKGNCAMMGLAEPAAIIHLMEDQAKLIGPGGGRVLQWMIESTDQIKVAMLFAASKKDEPNLNASAVLADPTQKLEPKEELRPEAKDLSIRVDFHKLDRLLDAVGELTVERNGLGEVMALLRRSPTEEVWARVERHVEMLGKLGAQIQTGITEARMLPVNNIFQRFVRMVRDLARKEKKLARLELRGGEVEVDKTILDSLSEPLLHLIRNSIGHGIELPNERRAKGKPEEGVIQLSASPQGNSVFISVSDDGQGIDPEKIKQSADTKGIKTDGFTTQELQALIFQTGFSTASQVSSLSGRGVGLDIVKRTIESLGGHLEVKSFLHKGTRFLLTIPLSLSLIKALLVDIGSEIYAIPLSHIVESLRLPAEGPTLLAGKQSLRWRGQVLSLFNIAKHFKAPLADQSSDYCVVVRDGNRVRGLMVHSLLGQREIVAKPLEAILERVPGISGVTLLGDGRVVPILDVFTLNQKSFAS